MHSSKLDNCHACGRLFLKEHSDYCLNCYLEIEEEFKQIEAFLNNEKNRNATIDEVTENTGISTKQVIKFIRDGRIFADDYPNLHYPCAYCGTNIKKQVLCNSCLENLSSDINKTLKTDGLVNEILQKQQDNLKPREGLYWRLKR